jgi:hypothetical protein
MLVMRPCRGETVAALLPPQTREFAALCLRVIICAVLAALSAFRPTPAEAGRFAAVRRSSRKEQIAMEIAGHSGLNLA